MGALSRRQLLVFIPTLAVSCWLGMMLVHEAGHILAAWVTGGRFQHLVFHPLAFSRTDIAPNPHPLAVAWGGPIFGAALPCVFCLVLRAARRRLYAAEMFAAFCLLANGIYVGLGSFARIGDAGDLLRDGSPIWMLWIFGITATAASMMLFHFQGPRLGLTNRARAIDVWLAGAAAVGLIVAGLFIDGR